MPFADNQGIRIHYEIVGQGPPLVMQYGQYFPLDVWHEYGYVDALESEFRLILVDARGQGSSDKPHDPEAYRIELMMSDIISVLDKLGLDRAHYMGYSSGGYLGFAIAKHALRRFCSFILGGTYPYPAPDEDSAWHADQARKLEQQTTDGFVADLEGFLSSQGFPALTPQMRSGLLKHDVQALAAWNRAAVAGVPAYDDILGSFSVPCLLYAGEKTDEYAHAARAALAMPGAAFVGIPNAGHLEGGAWIDILRPHIIRTVKSAAERENAQ